MAVPRVERRLAAILAADVVGYGRLMRADEEGALAALQAHRRDLVNPLLAHHRGRIVKLMGDGALVEFSSVSDAVRCAVAIQRGMAERTADTPTDRQIRFRSGIDLGDVIVDDQDIHGDGVNVASRLEALSPPGAVAVSAAVREQVGDHFEYNFVDLGVRTVKNGDRPLRIYLVDHPGAGELSTIAASPSPRPSIAVLPFENLSRDPDQDYFSEGVAEDLITDLSKISGLSVAGRKASFAARQTARDAVEASVRLQVGYVLEGSVRRAGERLRITAPSGRGQHGQWQVWAERYDRTLTDIFAVQDNITQCIIQALKIKLLHASVSPCPAKPTGNLVASNLYLRGLQLFRMGGKPSYELARRMFVRAATLDPKFARSLAGIADCDCYRYIIVVPQWTSMKSSTLLRKRRHWSRP